MIDVHARLIRHLEQVSSLNRELEFLPDDEVINERKVNHQGLVSPELAVVMAYCKIHLYARLLESDVTEDEFLAHDLERYFPPPLPQRFAPAMRGHRLRPEIIATVIANQLVDRAGTTFAFRMTEETGASVSHLARGYAVAREVFDMRSFWAAVEALDNKVEAGTQLRMLIEGRRLVERSTRWLVRASTDGIDIAATIEHFEPGAQMLARALPDALGGEDRERYDEMATELIDAAVPEELAGRVAAMAAALSVFDIVEVADAIGFEPEVVMETYFRLGSGLELNWLRDRIFDLPRANRWQALARAALRDDLYSLHRSLTQEVLEAGGPGAAIDEAIERWRAQHGPALERCLTILSDIKASRNYDMTTLPVALREVRNLIRGSVAMADESA
jgi:glutamate dehydrogenase